MNRYALAIIFVACLAACASSAKLPARVTFKDAQSLERFLVDKLPSGKVDTDLGLIEQEVDNLDGGAQRAAQAVLALRDIEQCNEDVLRFLIQVEAAQLNKPGDRVGAISTPLTTKVSELCVGYIEQNVLDKYGQLASDDDGVAKLFQVLRQRHEMFTYDSYVHPDRLIGNFVKPNILKRLVVAQDSGPIAANRANFDRLFDAHIGEPCKKLTVGLEDGYKKSFLVADLHSNWSGLLKQTSLPYRNIIWAYESCGKLLSMEAEQKSRMFNSMPKLR